MPSPMEVALTICACQAVRSFFRAPKTLLLPKTQIAQIRLRRPLDWCRFRHIRTVLQRFRRISTLGPPHPETQRKRERQQTEEKRQKLHAAFAGRAGVPASTPRTRVGIPEKLVFALSANHWAALPTAGTWHNSRAAAARDERYLFSLASEPRSESRLQAAPTPRKRGTPNPSAVRRAALLRDG